MNTAGATYYQVPAADLASIAPLAASAVLVIVGLALMVRAVRDRSTPLSLLGAVLLAGALGLLFVRP